MRLLVMVSWFALALSASAGTLAQFRTPVGDLEVELFDQDKPATVRNFIRLAEAGAYQNTFFHRCVPGFVIQGGGFFVLDRTSTDLFLPPFGVPNFGPITNEFAVGPTYSNEFGTIAMAKTTNGPDTATSQWFFNLANNATNLDVQNGGFTVFGRVLSGFPLLNAFNSLGLNFGIVNLVTYYGSAAATFSALPVLYIGGAAPHYDELLYVDVTLLRVAVSNAAPSGQSIAWSSATALTNVVEYTDGFPPAWQELARTNGTGARMSVTDPSEVPGRFYRVRVEREPVVP